MRLNPYSGDYLTYGQGPMHNWFTYPAPTAQSIHLGPGTSSTVPTVPRPATQGALANIPWVPEDSDPGPMGPPAQGLDLTKGGMTPEQARQAVSNYANLTDIINVASTIAPVPGSGIIGQLAVNNMEKQLATARGTLAHLGYVDPEKAKTVNTDPRFTTYSSRIMAPVEKFLSPVTTPISAAIDKTKTAALGLLDGNKPAEPLPANWGTTTLDPVNVPTPGSNILSPSLLEAQQKAEDEHYRSGKTVGQVQGANILPPSILEKQKGGFVEVPPEAPTTLPEIPSLDPISFGSKGAYTIDKNLMKNLNYMPSLNVASSPFQPNIAKNSGFYSFKTPVRAAGPGASLYNLPPSGSILDYYDLLEDLTNKGSNIFSNYGRTGRIYENGEWVDTGRTGADFAENIADFQTVVADANRGFTPHEAESGDPASHGFGETQGSGEDALGGIT